MNPDRNQPVIKDTRTESSVRVTDMVSQVKQFIPDGEPDDYIVGGEKPLSYQQVRRMRNRIKKDTGFDENIVPRRFRTTVLSDLYTTNARISRRLKQRRDTAIQIRP